MRAQTQRRRAAQAGDAGGAARSNLTADEAVARALERNVDARVAAPDAADVRLLDRRELRVLPADAHVDCSATTRATQLGRLTTRRRREDVNSDTRDWNGGVTQNVPWCGGNYHGELEQQPQRHDRRQRARSTRPTPPASRRSTRSRCCANFKIDNTARSSDDQRSSRTSPSSICRRRPRARSRRSATRTGSWCSRSEPGEPAQRRSTWRRSWCRTTARGWRSARWRRSTSCRRRPRKRPAVRQLVNAEATLQNTELRLKRLIVSGTDDPLWTRDAQRRPIGRRRGRKRSISKARCGTRWRTAPTC